MGSNADVIETGHSVGKVPPGSNWGVDGEENFAVDIANHRFCVGGGTRSVRISRHR